MATKVTEMFAFIAEDEKGDEGVMAFHTPQQGWMPLVGADIERVSSLIPYAKRMSQGKPYKILHFKLIGEVPVA
jgi:hypothetical protein